MFCVVVSESYRADVTLKCRNCWGSSVRKVEKIFGVSQGTVSKIMTTYMRTGKIASDKPQRRRVD